MASAGSPPRPKRATTSTTTKNAPRPSTRTSTRAPTRTPPPLTEDAAADDDMWELVRAHIMDVMEHGDFNDRTAIINKFGPVLMRKKDGQDVAIDIEAVRAEVRGWIEQTGRSFFND